MISCANCLHEFSEADTRKLGECNHDFCCECLVKYLSSMDDPIVKCMIPQCNGVIPDNIIRECLTDDQITAYEKLFVDSAIDARARRALKKKRRQDLVELNKKFPLIPNPDEFRCPICEDFCLPRTGVILRNCLHCFCLKCLKRSILSKDFISERRCPYEDCSCELDDGELYELDQKSHFDMVKQEASCRFFKCQSADCTGMWDATILKGTYKCPECSKINCLECGDIHDGKSCNEFRNTSGFTSLKDREDVFSDITHNKQRIVKCYICTRQFIHNDKCSATYCDGCGGHTCIFTGKISGSHDSYRCRCKGAPNCVKQYCGCTTEARCDISCLYGCVT